MKKTLIPKKLSDLKEIIKNEIKANGTTCDLNHIDVSQISDMSCLFSYSEFNGDISNWDVSNVKDMSQMFESSKFNQNISGWNVSNVKDMSWMFSESQFNQEISNWNVSNVEDMGFMFLKSQFNQDISKWNVSNAQDMGYMFAYSKFTHDLTNWQPLSVTNKVDIFDNCEAPIPYWVKAKNTYDAVFQRITIKKNQEDLESLLTNKSKKKNRIKI